jgi:hypothetical protein
MIFIYFFLLYYWFLIGFYKITDLDKPDSWVRNKIPQGKIGNFFYKMSECQYCMESNIGLLLSIPVIIYNIVDFQGIELFFFGWAASGLLQLIKTIKYADR